MVETRPLKTSQLQAGWPKWNTKGASKMLAPLDDSLDTMVLTKLVDRKVVTVSHPPDFR